MKIHASLPKKMNLKFAARSGKYQVRTVAEELAEVVLDEDLDLQLRKTAGLERDNGAHGSSQSPANEINRL